MPVRHRKRERLKLSRSQDSERRSAEEQCGEELPHGGPVWMSPVRRRQLVRGAGLTRSAYHLFLRVTRKTLNTPSTIRW